MKQGSPIHFVLQNNLAPYRSLVKENCEKAVKYPAGTYLTKQGLPIESMYFLLEGMVKISTFNNDGYLRILGYHGENTFFAMDGLRLGEKAQVSTRAVMEIEVVPISGPQVQALVEKNGDFARDLLLFYGDVLRLMCRDAELLSINSVAVRLINFITLYRQCACYSRLGYIPMTQENLASAINASRVQVARVCSQLKSEGLIRVGHGKLYILDEEKLGTDPETILNCVRD